LLENTLTFRVEVVVLVAQTVCENTSIEQPNAQVETLWYYCRRPRRSCQMTV